MQKLYSILKTLSGFAMFLFFPFLEFGFYAAAAVCASLALSVFIPEFCLLCWKDRQRHSTLHEPKKQAPAKRII